MLRAPCGVASLRCRAEFRNDQASGAEPLINQLVRSRQMASKRRFQGGVPAWCHLLWKSICFSMCRGNALWCHLAAKSLAISTNGSIRSESGRQIPVPRARLRTVPDTTLNRIRCPAFTRVFPKNRCGRIASGISPGTKKFFCKNVFHTKATPLWDRTIFGQVFVRGAMNKISKWKVPPTRGGAPQQAAGSCSLLRDTTASCQPRPPH